MGRGETLLTLLDDSDGTGNGSSVRFDGGKALFAAYADTTFPSQSVTLQIELDGTWVTCNDVTLTAAGAKAGELPPGNYRAVKTGGSPDGVHAYLIRVFP